MNPDDRPFRVLGVQQIAIGTLDKQALHGFWVDTLGLTVKGNFRDEESNVDEDILELGAGPKALEVDLMQPIDPERSPKVHKPALNHIGLWVDDIHSAVRWLTAAGVRFTSQNIGTGAAGHEVCFIHPKGDGAGLIGAGGALIELVQAPPTVIEALSVR